MRQHNSNVHDSGGVHERRNVEKSKSGRNGEGIDGNPPATTRETHAGNKSNGEKAVGGGKQHIDQTQYVTTENSNRRSAEAYSGQDGLMPDNDEFVGGGEGREPSRHEFVGESQERKLWASA